MVITNEPMKLSDTVLTIYKVIVKYFYAFIYKHNNGSKAWILNCSRNMSWWKWFTDVAINYHSWITTSNKVTEGNKLLKILQNYWYLFWSFIFVFAVPKRTWIRQFSSLCCGWKWLVHSRLWKNLVYFNFVLGFDVLYISVLENLKYHSSIYLLMDENQ